MFAERYRIVSQLGKGGMGVVYRADDLKLGQPVALKLLPASLAADPARLEAFRGEVRNARHVSHPFVCRVHDIGEAGGQHFLSMELIDGEDLASLLRRIGRLPAAKAQQLAAEICAGLAAAHAKGVIHRDLKPANVMIDGHGHARITDFGLAIRPEAGEGRGEVAGTPLYMSPEQAAGLPATARSDIWGLGVVLYELFTGRPPFEASSAADLRAAQEMGPKPPSRYARDIDPAVEKQILRCIERDPASRPASVAEVTAAIPGFDPLGAVVAAGRTPSPELVAAAGPAGSLRPAVAWALVLWLVAVLGALVALAPGTTLVGVARPAKRPEVLAERARELLAAAGHDGAERDSAFWFTPNVGALKSWVADREADRAEARARLLRFVYRQGPQALVSFNPLRALGLSNPPMDVPGMATVEMDGRGRLLRLRTVPALTRAPATEAGEPGWDELLRAAGLDRQRLRAVEPSLYPETPFDRRVAWRSPDGAAQPVEVAGASLGGRVVSLSVTPAGQRLASSAPGDPIEWTTGLLWLVHFLLWLGTSAFFARRNVRLGRSDLRGARRVAFFAFCLGLGSALLTSHLAFGTPRGFFIWLRTNGASNLWGAGVVWLVYVALEPYARRLWPDLLVGWSRAVAGRWRDPLVGRDVLIGSLAGSLALLVSLAATVAGAATTGTVGAPLGTHLTTLLGPRELLGVALGRLAFGLIGTLITAAMLAVGQAVFKRRAVAVVVAGLMLVAVFLSESEPWAPLQVRLLVNVAWVVTFLAVLCRFGALSAFACAAVGFWLWRLPLCVVPVGWLSGLSLLTLLVVGAVAVWGLVTSLGGRVFPVDDLPEA